MSDEHAPFELEDPGEPDPPSTEAEAPDAAPSPPATDPKFELADPPAREHAPKVIPKPLPDDPGPSAAPDPESAQPDPDSGVDTRTLKERRGAALPRGHDVIAAPEDWPREVFSYPTRGQGWVVLATIMIPLCLLDLLGNTTVGQFPAWILKLVCLVLVLRLQLRLVATSASGHDTPAGWEDALTLSSEELSRWASFMAMFIIALVPGWVLIVFDLFEPGLAFLALGSMYVSVLALGSALRDQRLKYPWNALGWMVKHPVSCAVGSMGWWTLGLVEYAVLQSHGSPPALMLLETILLRAASAYMLLLSARFLGVMGRSWRT